MPFQMKEKTVPTGRPSTYTSSDPPSPGARIVVSQYGGAASAAACSYVCCGSSAFHISHVISVRELTGGCSSTFSPRSGFALRFAKTPSDPEPPPYTLPPGAGCTGTKAGNWVTLLSTIVGLDVSEVVVVCVLTCSVEEVLGVPRINLCLSSPSLSSSLSDPSASKVSARFWSTSVLCRDGEEVRDLNEGGGELGI